MNSPLVNHKLNQNQPDQLLELKKLLESGKLDRKKHWRKIHRKIKQARKSNPSTEVIMSLAQMDQFFFDDWNVPKLPISLGTIILVSSLLLLQLFYWIFLPLLTVIILKIILYFLISFLQFTLSHVVFHWLVGRPLGIKFHKYFIFKSSFRKAKLLPMKIVGSIPILGIKYDLASFLRVSRWKRTLMFISAPVLTWFWFIMNYWYLMMFSGTNNELIYLVGLFTVLAFIYAITSSFLFKGDFWKASIDY